MTRWLALARALPSLAWLAAVLPVLGLGAALSWRTPAWPGYLLALVTALAGLAMLLRLASHGEHLRRERDRARHQAEHDALTGLFNRATWYQALDRQLAQAADEGAHARPLSVLLIDIDLFKLINDSLGHGVGDDCLRAVVAAVATELRDGDLLGRVGGEEFAVLLPGARRVHAIAIGERIRMAVQARCRSVGEHVVELSVSLGVAEHVGAQEAAAALLDRADRALYRAKDSGRNLVVADDDCRPRVGAGDQGSG